MDRFRWDLGRELPGDRDLLQTGNGLEGLRVALCISGGIAAYRAPDLVRALRREGADVLVYATPEALRFVSREALEWCSLRPVIDRLDGKAQHIEDSRQVDLYLVAPATYSTLNKLAWGFADNAVTTTLAGALGRLEAGTTQIMVAPTMHGSMVNSILRESLARLSDRGVKVLPPRSGAGKANLPDVAELVARCVRCLGAQKSPLAGRSILVTAGPTPTPVDDVRLLTNRFTGATGLAIAEALWRRGAEVELILGGQAVSPPSWIAVTTVESFDAYQTAVHASQAEIGIFSAAVADYQPVESKIGKIPSGGDLRQIDLVTTPKVIAEVKAKQPAMTMISFKLESGVTMDALVEIAKARLNDGSSMVVANRMEDRGAAVLVDAQGTREVPSRAELPDAVVTWLEGAFREA
ncbi:MAG TPA: bifunctional phosphopantothenoylcysteine decarboxylase/phosphopantothenate--cysteine ligase CoaBC [Myxococcales bacterium]|nr:bifunctional phosphopantothenoylcysteine decarboxylase/phosphopantothenate--cysteine ligase CoaBC [Myxococcales bacterium]